MPGFTVREAVPRDAEQILGHMERIAVEPDNGVTWSPGELPTLEDEQKILSDHIANEGAIFIVALSDTGQVIGIANFRNGRRTATRHAGGLGITVDQAWRNQGVGTAMMQSLIDWAKNTGFIKRMELEVFAHNQRAFHVYQKLGFKVEGQKHSAYFRDGRYVDAYMMALLFFRD